MTSKKYAGLIYEKNEIKNVTISVNDVVSIDTINRCSGTILCRGDEEREYLKKPLDYIIRIRYNGEIKKFGGQNIEERKNLIKDWTSKKENEIKLGFMVYE
jgi:hypothetical protein